MKKIKKWKPQKWERYWRVSVEGKIIRRTNEQTAIDKFSFANGNYSVTMSETAVYRKKWIEMMGEKSI